MLVLSQTLRALGAPRRLVPLGIVGGSVLCVEWMVSRDFSSVALDLALIALFVVVFPASWRWLGSPARRSQGESTLAVLGYVLLGTAATALVGVLLPVALHIRWTYVVEPPSLGIVLVLFLVGGWGLGRDIELEKGVNDAQRMAGELALQAKHAKLLALQAQLDPHFIFNTLNAIAEWCREDPVVAEKATLKLASVLRTILEGIENPSWPLARELELLENVLDLFRVRDEQRFRLRMEVSPDLPDTRVPPMILLPLFENAITHGPAAGHDGDIVVHVEASSTESIRVEIRNPGSFETRRPGGEGISIAERRLALAYGSLARLSIHGDGCHTTTVVSFPNQPSTSEELP